MSSSSDAFRAVPPTAGAARAAPSHARFIPREELGAFAAWQPGSLHGDEASSATPANTAAAMATATPAAAAEPGAPSAADAQRGAELAAARQAGYQDGYRDGLVALEGFKQSFAAQLSTQFGALYGRFDAQLAALDADIAAAVTQTAVRLARQVLRSELAAEPAGVARVAAEAVDALLLGARRITVRLHPQDLPLVAEGAADVLHSRGARLLADPAMARGGCVVESDLGAIDARIASRWAQAAAALGSDEPWQAEDPGAPT
jgi:flagellar assembly protein FliH